MKAMWPPRACPSWWWKRPGPGKAGWRFPWVCRRASRSDRLIRVNTLGGRSVRGAGSSGSCRGRSHVQDRGGPGDPSGGLAHRGERHGAGSHRDHPGHHNSLGCRGQARPAYRSPGGDGRWRGPTLDSLGANRGGRRVRTAVEVLSGLLRRGRDRCLQRRGRPMKTGFSGGIAQRFLNSKLTPLLTGSPWSWESGR